MTVVLDSEFPRCSFFAPGLIEPGNWEVSDEPAQARTSWRPLYCDRGPILLSSLSVCVLKSLA